MESQSSLELRYIGQFSLIGGILNSTLQDTFLHTSLPLYFCTGLQSESLQKVFCLSTTVWCHKDPIVPAQFSIGTERSWDFLKIPSRMGHRQCYFVAVSHLETTWTFDHIINAHMSPCGYKIEGFLETLGREDGRENLHWNLCKELYKCIKDLDVCFRSTQHSLLLFVCKAFLSLVIILSWNVSL